MKTLESRWYWKNFFKIKHVEPALQTQAILRERRDFCRGTFDRQLVLAKIGHGMSLNEMMSNKRAYPDN